MSFIPFRFSDPNTMLMNENDTSNMTRYKTGEIKCVHDGKHRPAYDNVAQNNIVYISYLI
jgi:hypothetical protein